MPSIEKSVSRIRSAVLVQILLPLFEANGKRQPRERVLWVRDELVSAFGGLTAYTRAPAEGLWEEPTGQIAHDEVVVYEVMCNVLDTGWWQALKAGLEERFHQREVAIRAQDLRLL